MAVFTLQDKPSFDPIAMRIKDGWSNKARRRRRIGYFFLLFAFKERKGERQKKNVPLFYVCGILVLKFLIEPQTEPFATLESGHMEVAIFRTSIHRKLYCF